MPIAQNGTGALEGNLVGPSFLSRDMEQGTAPSGVEASLSAMHRAKRPCLGDSADRLFDLNENVCPPGFPPHVHSTAGPATEVRRGNSKGNTCAEQQQPPQQQQQQHQQAPQQRERAHVKENPRPELAARSCGQEIGSGERIASPRLTEGRDGRGRGRGGGKAKPSMALRAREAERDRGREKEREKKLQTEAPARGEDVGKPEDVLEDLIKNMQNGIDHMQRCKTLDYNQLIPVQRVAQTLVQTVGDTMHKLCQQEKERTQEKAMAAHLQEISRMIRDHAAGMAALRKSKEAEMEKEQEKASCKICLTKSRDALLLPCMHFDYCFQCLEEHQLRSKTCPTCRSAISGVLQCYLTY